MDTLKRRQPETHDGIVKGISDGRIYKEQGSKP